MGPELAVIPGSTRPAVRNVRCFRGGPVLVVAVESQPRQSSPSATPVAGDADECSGWQAGKGVMVSENFATAAGFRLGETSSLPTPGGVFACPSSAS